MGLATKKTAPVVIDMGDCRDVFVNGVLDDIDLLPGNNVRLKCYAIEEHGNRHRVVDYCVWAADDLWDASVKVQEVLMALGYKRRMSRAN